MAVDNVLGSFSQAMVKLSMANEYYYRYYYYVVDTV